MTDPKKMAAMALEVLPPPDRLKKRPAPGGPEGADTPDDEDTEDSSTKAGEMAMEDFDAATSPGEKFAALKRAVEAIPGG